MSIAWGIYPPPPQACDCDGDTFTGIADFGKLSAEWGMCKGPSGITNPSRDYTECPDI